MNTDTTVSLWLFAMQKPNINHRDLQLPVFLIIQPDAELAEGATKLLLGKQPSVNRCEWGEAIS